MSVIRYHPCELRLITAEIIYHLPDYPELLQSFIWQNTDKVPEYPILRKFLLFWQQNIEGRLHSVQIACSGFPRTNEIRAVGEWLVLS